jgi:hypothetical protein
LKLHAYRLGPQQGSEPFGLGCILIKSSLISAACSVSANAPIATEFRVAAEFRDVPFASISTYPSYVRLYSNLAHGAAVSGGDAEETECTPLRVIPTSGRGWDGDLAAAADSGTERDRTISPQY